MSLQPIQYPRQSKKTSQPPPSLATSIALRQLRRARKFSLRRLAAAADINPSQLSSWETGKSTPPIVIFARLLGILRVDNATTRTILDLAGYAGQPGYIDARPHDHAALAWHYEHLATHVFQWAPTLIPDLLRTPAHDLHLLDHPLADLELADAQSKVAATRRANLGDLQRHYTFILADTALDACPPQLRTDQLTYLTALAHRPKLTIKIVPAAECGPAAGNPFTLFRDGTIVLAIAVHHNHASSYFAHRSPLAHHHRISKWLLDHSVTVTDAPPSGTTRDDRAGTTSAAANTDDATPAACPGGSVSDHAPANPDPTSATSTPGVATSSTTDSATNGGPR
ncbi:helix-turn-helix transcriptional regulator [Amycolatopsis sp. NBC_00355]|uniref:Scr1 family TA system antitoxin-like transcriptional regulator n=1 Tax=Amycolatopsis sp. NBC_00355 TaxID=2975957 RepID=UPI002E2655C0